MTSLLAFAVTFCADHVDVIIILLKEITQYVDEHLAKIPNDPDATMALQALVNDASARAISAVTARARGALNVPSVESA